MHLFWPPALKGDNNPYTKEADPRANYPYGCCGQTNTDPCKGHLGLLDTEEGTPVVEWQAGAKANFSLSGAKIQSPIDNPEGGNHFGGSCQVGFSTDKGKTFKVATTWQGNCPLRDGGIDPAQQVFDFTVPADLPSGKVVFAWTWVNREQEFNMNCASVSIIDRDGDQQQPPQPSAPTTTPSRPTLTPSETGSAPLPTSTPYKLEGCTCLCPLQTYTEGCRCTCESPTAKRHLVERRALSLHKEHIRRGERLNVPVRRSEIVAFSERPDMLMLDFTGTGCQSVRDKAELKYPNPGPEVVDGDGEYPLAPPTGSC